MDTKGQMQVYVLARLAEERHELGPAIEEWVFRTRRTYETSGETMRYWACCYQAPPGIVCCVMRVSDRFFWLGFLEDVVRSEEVPLEVRDKLAEAVRRN